MDSPAACPFWQPSKKRSTGGNFHGVDVRGDDNSGGGGGGDGGGGGVGMGMGMGVDLPRKIFTISANDLRVEFPYQRGVCCGDMEHEDVIRWLRHFCGSFVSEEDGAGREPCSCQFVEARSFDLSIRNSGSVSEDGVLPELNCAILGVSVSSAEYLSNVGVGGSFPGLLLRVGDSRARNGVECSERPEVSPRPGTTMTSIPEASPSPSFHYSDGSGEMQTPLAGDRSSDRSGTGEEETAGVGRFFSGIMGIRRRSRDRRRRRRYSLLPVSLGGTRHSANTRKR